MGRHSARGSVPVLIAASLVIVSFLGPSKADNVLTWPRPGYAVPPPIAPGECPLVFSAANIQHAKSSACSSGTAAVASSSGLPFSCCGQLRAVLFQARVRYANATGRLLLPQASADACIQSLDNSLMAAGIPFLGSCSISSAILSEDIGKACGKDLTTVYDFWSASNRTFPGVLGTSCYGSNADCSLCNNLITNKIMSLSMSTTALLSNASCQSLAQVAMTAAAYPTVVANGISQCLHSVDIETIPMADRCTAFDWSLQNFTAVTRSCGPQLFRADRCCDLILGMYNQVLNVYVNKTAHELPEAQVEVCFSEFKDALSSRKIPSATVNKCQITAAVGLYNVGCYNYTTIYQRFPKYYHKSLEATCVPEKGNCSSCPSTLRMLGAELANTSDPEYRSHCELLLLHQYFAWWPTAKQITDRINCYNSFPPELQLGLPRNASTTSDGPVLSTGQIAGIGTGAGVAFLAALVVGVCLCVRCWTYPKPSWSGELKSLEKLSSFQLQAAEQRLQVFSRWQLRKATDNFSETRLLGGEGSGKVYIGEMKGETVAIKEVDFGANKDGTKEAWNEVATLAQYRHRHLVILKGCCMSNSECSLVYEFMEHGSLEDHLYPGRGETPSRFFKSLQPQFLDWTTRMKIALGTANGLAYLHDEAKPRCIHRDVKPSNILLTHDFEAKLANFGLAKATEPDVTHVTTGIAGTWGFLSPEYMATGQLTEKSDVYSYGVVLLTLLSGRHATNMEGPKEEMYLPEWAWTLAEGDELDRLIDPRLEKEKREHAKEMGRMTRIALLCVHTSCAVRPSMRACANMLLGHVEVPELPTRPTTVYTTMTTESDHSESGSATLERQTSDDSRGSSGAFSLSTYPEPAYSEAAVSAV